MDLSKRKLAAIVFSDIVDCTKIISKNESLGLEYIKDHTRVIKGNVGSFNGTLLKELGDGCLLIFDSTYDAIKFSKHIQKTINNDKDYKVRVGIHVGDVINEGEDYFGSGVNIASRIHAFADPGGICFTQDVHSQTKSHTDINSSLVGDKRVKGVSDKIKIFKIINEGEDAKKTPKSKKTLISEINDRRVPQFLGIYAAAGWTLIQFVDWITTRYQYSPHLVDLSLAIVLSMIPSIIILSYFHGAPGKDKWNKIEKIGIPLNIATTLIIMFVLFYPKDLGATTKTVSYEHMCSASCALDCKDDGKIMDRVIPKAEFRKSLTLYNFETNINEGEEYLSYAIPYGVNWDMGQDVYVMPYNQKLYIEGLRKYNKTSYDVISLSLQRELSLKGKDDYFINGKITKEGSKYNILVNIYDTKSYKKIASKTFVNENVFTLTDEISLFSRKNIGIPLSHIEESIDLEAEEIITKSVEAYKFASKGAAFAEEDHEKAMQLLESAVSIDDTFVLAYLELHNIYQAETKSADAMRTIEKMIDNIYKLPERMRFIPNVLYYFNSKQPDKAFKVALMQSELYPDDVLAHNILAQFYSLKGEHEKEIETYKIIINLYNNDYGSDIVSNYIKKIGQKYLYELGDYENALKYFEEHLYGYPDDYTIYETLGNLYERLNDIAKAKDMYSKALLHDTGDIGNMLELVHIQKDIGVKRIDECINILEKCKNFDDSLEVYFGVSGLYDEYGMYEERLNLMNEALKRMEDKYPLSQYGGIYLEIAKSHAKINEFDVGMKVLSNADKVWINESNSVRPAMWKVDFYYHAEKWELIKEQMMIAMSGYKEYGIKYTSQFKHEAYVSEHVDNDFNKAIDLYEKFLEENPATHYADIHINIARCYRLLGEHKKAKRKLDSIYDTSLKWLFEADYEYALLYRDMGNNSKALEKVDLYLEHYKHAHPKHIKVNRAKALKNDLLESPS